eukprot:CAMPEP_0194329070 /NCGR_PEP_ID=MMETSP0171-20130528/46911_1 /TAXON_ID=218684 /ORGANISM="Corethron pennatum, Strain L29A3" /LENGTH=463 /DNA_ID=CAMNT_0039089665 /DNA_START=224 /DNA_END=1615 /DNA_ORIENTATION=+
MKLSLAAFFLGNFFLTLKCPNTSASEIRTRRPKKIRDAEPLPGIEISQKCGRINKFCSAKKKCCNGLTCLKEKGAKGKCADLRTFQLRQELLLQYSGNDIEAVSTSHDSETTLVQGVDSFVTHILSGLFQSPVLVPGFSETLTRDDNIFNPTWTNCVSGDGGTIALSDNRNGIVQVYKLKEKFDNIKQDGWYLFGQIARDAEAHFGTSLALSFKGNILVVGSDYAGDNREGALQRFELRGGNWVSVGNGIIGQFPNDKIGRSPLEISRDTSRILVGGGQNGFASVYDWDKEKEDWNLMRRFSFDCTGWSECVCDRSCIKEGGNPMYGEHMVFLSNNGNIVAIGEYDYDPKRKEGVESEALRGAIHFYVWKDNKFVTFAKKLVGPRNDAEFGWTFGMSDDGTRLVTGDFGRGEVYHYKKVGNKFEKFETIATGGFYTLFLSRDGTKLTVTSTKSNDQVDTYTLE